MDYMQPWICSILKSKLSVTRHVPKTVPLCDVSPVEDTATNLSFIGTASRDFVPLRQMIAWNGRGDSTDTKICSVGVFKPSVMVCLSEH